MAVTLTKRCRLRALLLTGLLGCGHPAQAEETRVDLLYACNAGSSRIELVEPGFAGPGWENGFKGLGFTVERIASHALIRHTGEGEQGNVAQRGSLFLKHAYGESRDMSAL
jgi:hypothetical protein